MVRTLIPVRSASWSMVSRSLTGAAMSDTVRHFLTYVTVLLLHGFMAEIPEAYVYDAIRTPRGRGKASGSLHEVKPVSLVVDLIGELRSRHPELDTNQIDDVVLGVVSPLGDQGGDIAKTAAIAAGLPDTVAGVQLNRFCASGLEAVNTAALKVRSGMEELVLAGGVEVMSRVPMGSDGGAWAMDPDTSYTTGFVPQGIGADLIATLEGFSREDVDTFAVESQTRAAKAWANGYFAKSVIPVKDRNGLTVLDRDEHIRAGATLDSLAGLQPSFAMMGEAGGFDAVALQRYHWVEKINHVHHAGNSSGIVDGAALTLIGSEAAGKANSLTPRARIVATAISGADPTIMLTGPAPASRKALAKAGLTVADIDLFEINEAFAAVAMRYMKDMGISHEQTNVNGGSIAMGHPLGATGAMILGTLIDELERRDLRRGLATLCVGGGMGIATIVERI
jgi:acetyl-CoA C-acetyltransferase